MNKKILKCIIAVLSVVLGIVLWVCNWFKYIPIDNIGVIAIIAYGPILGTLMIMAGIETIKEVWEEL